MTSPRAESHTGTSKSPSGSDHIGRRVLIILGTRPEAIKLGPLIAALRDKNASRELESVVCATGQHREMLSQALRVFNIEPDYQLDVMNAGQSLARLTSRLMAELPAVFDSVRPSIAVVQGDTTTTLCGAQAAFYARVPVAHVEAGLRTFNMNAPFPEEMNRVLTTRLADLHFAATEGAANNLRREGVADEAIEVTGNTGIDAVLDVRRRLEDKQLTGIDLALDRARKLILVTAHRRENFGPEFSNVCRAIARLADRHDVQVVWPVHRNPNVAGPVKTELEGRRNVLLLDPLDYVPFVDLMARAYLLITDSGGIQEEAPSLGKPVLVLRSTTERPEAVEAGTVKLVGTNVETIITEAARLLDRAEDYAAMSRLYNPYGDGQASRRIVKRIASYLRVPLP